MDGLDLYLGLVVDFISDEMGVGNLGVVVVDLVGLAVDLEVQGLGMEWGDRVRLGHLDHMMMFGLMMLKCHRKFGD